MTRPAKNLGFTLVETMVIVVVLGLLLAASIPDFADSNRRRRVEAATDQIATALQIARQRAIATRVPHRVVLDPENRAYWTERSQSDSTWVMDPDEIRTLPTAVNWSSSAGGDPENLDIEFESRGTVLAEDAPFTAVFSNAHADTFAISLVRTGRLTICGAP
ncbi:MAG: hypothetical protein FJY88_00605 [Candidatus Eisenbacteria bacterium]|nr:hypothetical protein [Candidatus Eisenbacteria bacterium]